MTQLKVEFNARFTDQQPMFNVGGMTMLVTPPVGEDYWMLRVKLSDKQAIIGFPKFGTIGVGFAVEEEDWNTNLPYTCEADEIYEHIKENKGDPFITKETCIAAIKLIQEAIKSTSN